MQIREITLADAQQYQQLLHDAYRPVLELGIHFAAATADLALIETHLRSNLAYGIFIQDQLACSVSLRLPWGNNPGPFGVPHIGWFATHPNFKQQGLAVKLLAWLEQHILRQQLKVPFVTLGTAENHPWLAKFYMNHGFVEIGRTNLTDDHTTVYYRKIIDETLFQLYQQHHAKN
ncbi:GNAT family N-acetyltransferase [Aggregatibacter actinomycetemcomitans]|nr:GNAT family N-acetyltransferase [Aggregatibacter actinomycetemcomitans]